jgi:hypothetical protein
MIDVTCPQCGAVYHSEESHIGKRLRCARCSSLVPILEAVRNVVRPEPIPAPSFKHARQAQPAKRKSSFKSSYVFPVAACILLAVGAVSLIVYATHAGSPSPAPTIVDEEPIPKAEPTVVADPRPTEYNSLPTGTRIEGCVGGGHGELKVDNGTTEDAVVRLSDVATDGTVCWFSVQAHSSAHMKHIPQGRFTLAFTTGLNWNESEDIFTWHPSYDQFDQVFEFNEQRDSERVRYNTISVTLNPVLFGNVRTKTITREEFLKGHRHVALQR